MPLGAGTIKGHYSDFKQLINALYASKDVYTQMLLPVKLMIHLDKPLKQMRDPVPDEEIETYTESKRMNVMCHGNADVDTTTVKDVKNVSKDTGTDESMIVYTDQTPTTSGTNPKQYEDNFPRKKPLKRMCDPLSDEEIESETIPKHGENTDI